MKRLILFVAVLLTGCASFKPKLDADRAHAVKKVAVLSVMILQEQPKDALGFSKVGELKHGRIVEGPEFQNMARAIAGDFSQELKQKPAGRW